MKTDSRLKILLLLLVAVVSFLPLKTLALVGLAVVLVILGAVMLGAKTAWKVGLSILPVLLIMTILSPFSYRDQEVMLEYNKLVILTYQAFDMLLTIGSRFIILSYGFSILVGSTDQADLVQALRCFGIPFRAGLMISLILRFLPELSQTFNQISESHALRGRRNRFSETIGSLISSLVMALRRIPLTAMALEQRGLGRRSKVTSYHQLKPFGKNYGILALSIVLLSGFCFLFWA